MCTYCMMGDWAFQHDPPFSIPPSPVHPFPSPLWPMVPVIPNILPVLPTVPAPLTPGPHEPWDLAKLEQFLELIRRVKAMEDELGCPCEPNKVDYVRLLEERVAKLEALESSGTVTIDKIEAPWSADEVRALRNYQRGKGGYIFHPYTCGNDSSILVPTEAGWKCKQCDYKQTWAWNPFPKVTKNG